MRPQILFPLAAPATSIKGVGVKFAVLLKGLLDIDARDVCVSDLLWHLPSGLIDRSRKVEISELAALEGERVLLEVVVGKHSPSFRGRGAGRRAPYRVEVYDDSASMQLVFFHARGDYLKKLLPLGETRFVSGSVEVYRELPQMTHPDYILTAREAQELPMIEPVYPLCAGLRLQKLGKLIRDGLKLAPALEEWDEKTKEQMHFPSWKDALLLAHHPKSKADLAPAMLARERLAYDELLANQLALALIRHWKENLPASAFPRSVALRQKVLKSLDYELTPSQCQALEEIDEDMAKPKPMLRLLQGDVGSGKTITAFCAMLNAVEAQAQAALMAPTEILAQQHANSLRPLCDACGISLDVLTSRTSGIERDQLLKKIKAGEVSIIIGTHSLFQKDVIFDQLGLVVIDEQHKFGVHQRLLLSSKSLKTADVLAMTATPIPRTLTLTSYGDMDISVIKEKPRGRGEITTRALPAKRIGDITKALERAVANEEQAYWVCPFIEPNEYAESKVITATERYAFLRKTLPFAVGLIHGRMKAKERDEVLSAFKAGEIKLLVATSVIEVGMDIPNATIMVIEHAERFGLAQLHQLRGRVGRGSRASSCLLLYAEPLGETARQRLDALRKSNDGFEIAEIDLALRGFGELLGTRQSGAEGFRLVDLRVHKKLLALAAERAREIVAENPRLEGEEGEKLRVLLYLFRRDEVSNYARSG